MNHSGTPKGRIYTFRDFIGPITWQCRICQAHTTVEDGATHNGCEHIEVIYLDETPEELANGGGA